MWIFGEFCEIQLGESRAVKPHSVVRLRHGLPDLHESFSEATHFLSIR
jgi:hypothetical protein